MCVVYTIVEEEEEEEEGQREGKEYRVTYKEECFSKESLIRLRKKVGKNILGSQFFLCGIKSGGVCGRGRRWKQQVDAKKKVIRRSQRKRGLENCWRKKY